MKLRMIGFAIGVTALTGILSLFVNFERVPGLARVVEFGAVTELSLNRTPWNTLRSVVSSMSGMCAINNMQNSFGKVSLEMMTYSPNNEITVSCREHDDNGGDCNIRGELECL
jgi:hypothetical protein